MSQSSLKKKLQPAKKAWKSFAKTVNSKLRSFSFSRAVNVIKTHSHRLLSYCSLHFFHKRSLTTQPYRHRHHRHNNSYLSQYHYCNNKNKNLYHHRHNTNFSPIYIDQLYSAETGISSVQAKRFHAQPESSSNNSISRDKEKVDEKALPKEEGNSKRKEKILYSIEDAWREVVLKSPQLRPVDDRAEEFISKFRQEIKLQKEKSILEFQEMLARGT